MAEPEANPISPSPANAESFTGRSVFLVETTAAGVSVQTGLLTNDGQLLRAPAVFPDIEYAFSQIDELKRLVSRHFSEAARIGAQVLAAQQAAQLNASSTASDSPAPVPATPEVAAQAQTPAQAEPRPAKTKKSAAR